MPDAVTGPDVLVTATATDLAGNTATAKVPAGKDNTPAPIIDSGHFVDTSGAHDNNPEGTRLKGHLPKKPNGEEYPVGTIITIVDDQNNVVGTGVITENNDGTVKKDGTFDILTVEHPNNPIGPITPETIANFKVIAQEPNKNPSPAVDAPVTGEIAHIGDHTPPAPSVASVDYSGEEPVGKVKLPTNGENTKHPVQEGDQGTITVKDPDGNTTFVVGVTFKEGKWVRDPAPEHTEGELDGDTFTIPAHKLQEGSTVSVVTHDKLGNRSPESSDVVIGQTEPVTELTVTSYDGNAKADRDPDLFDLQGKTSAPAGSQVTIKANGQVVATAIVQAGPNGENTFSVKLKESADNNIKVGDTFTATVEQDGKRPSKPFTSAAVQAPEDFNPADHIGDRTQPTAPVEVVSTEEGNQDKQYTLGDDVDRVIVHVVPTGKPKDLKRF
ncbi:hypothetical protein GVX86_02525 [[Haemophilus] felis]|nr:hypothetical protein [[Haemophilus] felis]